MLQKGKGKGMTFKFILHQNNCFGRGRKQHRIKDLDVSNSRIGVPYQRRGYYNISLFIGRALGSEVAIRRL
jgi:hypothetical protein